MAYLLSFVLEGWVCCGRGVIETMVTAEGGNGHICLPNRAIHKPLDNGPNLLLY